MATTREKLAQTQDLPPEIEQPNIFPLSWHRETEKMEEIYAASQREIWDPLELP